jgi:hypothetical protein
MIAAGNRALEISKKQRKGSKETRHAKNPMGILNGNVSGLRPGWGWK